MHAEVEVAVEVALSCPQSAVFHISYIYEFICEYVYIYICTFAGRWSTL